MAPLIPQRKHKLPMLFNPVKEYERSESSLLSSLASRKPPRKTEGDPKFLTRHCYERTEVQVHLATSCHVFVSRSIVTSFRSCLA
jgi:hypothetical protein